MDFFARKWLLAQIVVLGVQIPLRMEVQRSLFCVSTSQDTAEATRRLRAVFLSSAWWVKCAPSVFPHRTLPILYDCF